MDPQVLAKIVQALNIIHSPHVSNEERIEAQKYCNTIKDYPYAPHYGQFLATKNNGQSDIVRHFGLQLIENSVRFHWNNYDQSEREQIKQYVIDLVQQGTHDILTEKLFIKEKLAKLLANIVKLEWPIRWTDMDQLLHNLYIAGPTTQELVLIIFRCLAEEIDLRDSLTCIVGSSSALQAKYPDGVKNDSSRAGELTIMQGEPNNEGWLVRWIRSLEQLITEWQYQSPTLLIHERLAIATINAITTHVEWIFAKAIVEANTVLTLTNCLLSDCYGIKMEAIECLSVVLSRTFQTPEDRASISEPFYEHNGLDLLIAVYSKIQPPGQIILLDEHEYKFLKKFVEVIVEIGEKHICFRNNTSIPKQFPKYLELVYEISKHPSNVIASTTTVFWQSALKHPHISKGFNEQEGLSIMLLELFAERLKILFQPEDADNEITYYIELDGYSSEYRIFAQTLRAKLIDTIKAITLMKAIPSFNWMVDRVQRTLNVNPGPTDLDESGVCKVDSLFYITFEAEMTLMDSIVMGMGKIFKLSEDHNAQKTQITSDLKNLLQMLLSLDYSDVVMTHRYLAALVSFVDLLIIDSSLLFSVLQKIFTFAVFLPPEYTVSAATPYLPIPIQRLRSGAISTLIKFGSAMPDVLMNIYTEIYNYVYDLVSNRSNMVTGKEKSTLQEFLLSIIYYSSQPLEQKQLLFDPIVSATINEWNSPQFSRFVGPLPQFCDASGINFLSSVVNEMKQNGTYIKSADIESVPSGIVDQYKMDRNKLVWLENTTLIWLRRTTDNTSKKTTDLTLSRVDASLWGKYIPTILSTTLSLIRLLHQIWNIETWREMPIELQEILVIGPEEKASLLGQLQKYPFTDLSNKPHTIADMMDQIRKWLITLRTDCYYVLGRLTVLGPTFYSISDSHEPLTQALFENVESLNNIHWKMLLNILS
ncbi:378_t:CDS:10 [Acaulospora morrowiae]|uniref:378_t:CDS:1 n=1 Tax=Acaulospora morrowiae TaxID=94023 RepID=A0A9N9ASI1_9GLOM|nr:378_t:CDS:10 [Acaulospora morrowiae]